MTKIIGAAAILTIALATYAASINPYETRKAPHEQSQQTNARDIEHTASIR
ncbi:hypothetical protein [Rhizobium sp. 18055]|jgi:hypothetical protein|uniref:hypothetical protein n=1 Tax=Rhizobium sp. 18055 TaxID=2681403 RepID=UPI00190FAB76|nr:hypothetical protein [Rhizobium sp. 18055]